MQSVNFIFYLAFQILMPGPGGGRRPLNRENLSWGVGWMKDVGSRHTGSGHSKSLKDLCESLSSGADLEWPSFACLR